MKLKALFFILFFSFSFCFFPPNLIALTPQFNRNLRPGDTGEDVRSLQVVLNSDSRTMVAVSGIGSKGQESTYFGQKTKMAVMKFQSLYLPEILGVGSDTIAPTGYVGSLTRGKLNSKPTLSTTQLPTQIPSTIPVPPVTETAYSVPQVTQKSPEQITAISFFNSSVYKNKPQLINLSRYEAKQGMQVVVNGFGFLQKENIIHIGHKYTVPSVSNSEGTVLSFIVPDSVPNGKYNLFVSNTNGDTQNILAGDYFTITSNPKEAPIIESIFPATIEASSVSKTITIKGKNFDNLKNSIYSNLGNIENVSSSDGNTISVSLSDFSSYKSIKSINGTSFEVPVYIFVKNDGGISQTQTFVNLKF